MKGQRIFRLTLISILTFLPCAAAPAQVTFTDVTGAAGFGGLPEAITWATWGDYNNDGDVDVIFITRQGSLYRNEGDGRFLEVTEAVGITGVSFRSDAGAAIFVDFDNDGNLDLFLGSGGILGDLLYRNRGDGTFLDVSEAAGMESNARDVFGGAISFDYDNDGLLDIFVANYNSPIPFPNFLYRNEGNGHFKEIAAQIGLDKPEFSIGPVLGDYDNDGDLYWFRFAFSHLRPKGF
ncbi:VCBS repeat-containing protein [Candidatus Poribacteria bacterium]|nr:VCBS repeat-containing protein [Candidatus Poribacteria bacterium]